MANRENINRIIQVFQENPEHELDEIQELILDSPDEDIKSSSKQFLTLCHILTSSLIRVRRSVSGIRLLTSAIAKLQTHPRQLTPLHSDLCLLCLESKCLNPALQLLDVDYTEIRTTEDKEEDVKHVLLFYYYGGLIYAAVKNFDRASHFFEVVLTMPAHVMNPIMQETYKKHIILTLLVHGKLPENILPKYASACVTRQRKQLGYPYLKLANEYSSLNYEKIRRFVNGNSSTYERDENMGLIKQCLTQVHKRNIQRLTQTFLTLPLRDVANYVGLASEKEAELYILNMIDDGEISATINQRDGMVVFQDSLERFDTSAVFQKLQEDMSATMTLINTLKKMESEVPESRSLCKMNSDI